MIAPSRFLNPFATCWTNPGIVAYQASHHDTPERLVNQLSQQQWQGEIVGPHGMGKSTLLHAMEPLAIAGGKNWLRIDLQNRGGQSDRRRLGAMDLEPASLLVVDGFEQLTPFHQRQVRRRCRRAGAGFLVTSHAPTGLPLLTKLAPDQELALACFRSLTADRSTPVTESDVRIAFHAYNGNIRELLFDLYDLHERRS